MVTAENTLYFFGGKPHLAGADDRMKVHAIELDTGVVVEDVEVSGKAPMTRRGHYAFFFRDPQAGPVIYVCGGVAWDSSMQLNDMYCLNLSTLTWNQVMMGLLSEGSPPPTHTQAV